MQSHHLLGRTSLLAALALLAACGRGERTTEDPVGQNVAAAAAAGVPANVAAAVDCSNTPDFVPVYADATILSCTAAPDGLEGRHVSGNLVYQTDASVKQVLGWSRAQANASGLKFRRENGFSYEAGEESERSLRVVAESHLGRTRVTISWGQKAA
ncbi:hypothetical protein S2M10_41920 [Sphingomonas sp. S2M10]|uniref:hypothetical protein n=1 Tax=Sphingomonas sp. S2M10 TaxID=2705010 RepID=UPI0014576184|nr:hypothetical protein [Sphingomonas sp. S2M10]NLS29172.1 hypothetical protein [Sphingomonas sp. S2M10]